MSAFWVTQEFTGTGPNGTPVMLTGPAVNVFEGEIEI